MNLADQIKNCRTNVGLSQTQLAEKLMVSRQAVSKWESGAGTPDISNLKAMAELFEVSVDFLLGEEKQGAGAMVIRFPVDVKGLEPYKQPGKLMGSKAHAAVIAAHPRATKIEPLTRRKKSTKKERFWDVVQMIGLDGIYDIFSTADSLSNIDSYYLVTENNRQLLARVSKECVESRELPSPVEEKSFQVGMNSFRRTKPLVLG